MSTYLKRQSGGIQLLIFGVITFATALLLTFVGVFIVSRSYGVPIMRISSLTTTDFAKPENAGIARALLVVQFFAVFFIPSMIFARMSDRQPLSFAGLKMPDGPGFIGMGVLVILCAYFSVMWLSDINQSLVKTLFGKAAQRWIEEGESGANGMLENILDMKTAKDLIVSIILVGALAAIGEEIFFRGILQRIFIQIFRSPAWGIVVTAAIFSAIHGQFLGFLPRWILGMVLGALYWYSGSLLPAIAGHFIFNTGQILLVYFKVINADSPPVSGSKAAIIGIPALALVVYLLNLMRKRSTTTYEKVYPSIPDSVFEESDRTE